MKLKTPLLKLSSIFMMKTPSHKKSENLELFVKIWYKFWGQARPSLSAAVALQPAEVKVSWIWLQPKLHFAIQTNILCNTDKFILKSRQIYLSIFHWDGYIFQFRQIHFTIASCIAGPNKGPLLSSTISKKIPKIFMLL